MASRLSLSVLCLATFVLVASATTSVCLYKSGSDHYYSLPTANALLLEDVRGTFRISTCGSWLEAEDSPCFDSAVCYTHKLDGRQDSYGSLQEAHYAELPNGVLGLEIAFGGGDQCSPDGAASEYFVERKAVVQLICDPSLPPFVMRPLGEPIALDSCGVLIQLNSSDACPAADYCSKIATRDIVGCGENPFCVWDKEHARCSQVPNPDEVFVAASIGQLVTKPPSGHNGGRRHRHRDHDRNHDVDGNIGSMNVAIFTFFGNRAVQLAVLFIGAFVIAFVITCGCAKIRDITKEKRVQAILEESHSPDEERQVRDTAQPAQGEQPAFASVFTPLSPYDMAMGAAPPAPVAFYGAADEPHPSMFAMYPSYPVQAYYVPATSSHEEQVPDENNEATPLVNPQDGDRRYP